MKVMKLIGLIGLVGLGALVHLGYIDSKDVWGRVSHSLARRSLSPP